MSIVHGTIKKIDKTTKAIVVKRADGTEHTSKVIEQVTVHGTKESFDDLKEGSEVVTRYTADELGEVGNGMKVTKGNDNQDRQRHKDCRGQVR